MINPGIRARLWLAAALPTACVPQTRASAQARMAGLQALMVVPRLWRTKTPRNGYKASGSLDMAMRKEKFCDPTRSPSNTS